MCDRVVRVQAPRARPARRAPVPTARHRRVIHSRARVDALRRRGRRAGGDRGYRHLGIRSNVHQRPEGGDSALRRRGGGGVHLRDDRQGGVS